MNIEEITEYCLTKKHVTQDLPFGPDVLALKVHNKIFALIPLVGEFSINLKCNPEKAILLRDEFSFVIPAYHMNKTHWNTIIIENNIFKNQLLLNWIDDSYNLVYNNLPKKIRILD